VSTRPHLLTDGAPIAAEPIDEVAELRERLDALESRMDELESSYGKDREYLARLLGGLRAAFMGGINEESPSSTSTTTTTADRRWDTWITKLGGKQGEFIRALLDHGAMTREQLKISTHSGSSTVDVVLRKLKGLSLITKSGDGRWQLKQL
jgi:hypothetical protein